MKPPNPQRTVVTVVCTGVPGLMCSTVSLLVFCVLLAGSGATLGSAQSKAPPPAPPRTLTLPEPREFRLENGLTVVLVEDHRAPIVTFVAGVPQRTSWQRTVAGLTSQMTLVEATADLLADGAGEEFTREVESLGGQVDSNAGADYAIVSGVVISENANRFTELFAVMLARPKFLANEIDLYKNSRIDKLAVARQAPAFVAREHFNRLVYGAHPYGITAPTPAAVRALSRSRILRFYKSAYSPAETVLVIVGDFDSAAMQANVRATFGQWKAAARRPAAKDSEVRRPNPESRRPLSAAHSRLSSTGPGRMANRRLPSPSRKTPASPQVYLIDRPGSTQSDFRVGNLAISRADADYFALLVANAILGDGTSSRLFLDIREQQGYAYDVSSAVSALKAGGSFFGNAQSRTEVTGSAIKAMLGEFARLGDEAVPAEDLRNAKNYLAGLFSLSLATQGGIGDELLTMKLVGLGDDYLKTYRAKIEAVTAADVQRVARKYINSVDPTIVIVGDASQLRKQLAALGAVTLVKTQGKTSRRSH